MNIIPWILLISWAVFILYWAISAFSVKLDINQSAWQRWWWVRLMIIFTAIGWVWATSRIEKTLDYQLFFGAHATGVLAVCGAAFCILGIALAIWARVHLGRNWSPAPALKEEHELVTTGPYALVRHPIYTGIMVATLGSTIANPVWLIIFFIITAMFVWRVHVEENLMLKQFPNQYPEYQKRTWALIPYVW